MRIVIMNVTQISVKKCFFFFTRSNVKMKFVDFFLLPR